VGRILTGGCFCGTIRYEADGAPFRETNCHCSICRRTTDTPFLSMFSVKSIEFRIIKGRPTRFNSTAKTVRSFCSRCGTQLTGGHTDFPDETGITTASLDNPNLVPPRVNIHTSSRLEWVVPDGLPEYREGARQG